MSPNEDHVDSAIRQVEQLYSQVTGQPAPEPGEAPYAAIPAERNPVQYVEEQIERLAQALGGTSANEPAPPTFIPAASLWEDTEGYVVFVDLPGVPRASLSISVAGSAIEITGQRPPPRDAAHAQLRWTERVGGAFRRLITLPPAASTSAMRAELADGTLCIRVPRETEARTIAVT